VLFAGSIVAWIVTYSSAEVITGTDRVLGMLFDSSSAVGQILVLALISAGSRRSLGGGSPSCYRMQPQ
jgi:hypothetical protein